MKETWQSIHFLLKWNTMKAGKFLLNRSDTRPGVEYMQLQTKVRRLLCKGASPHCARQLLPGAIVQGSSHTFSGFSPGCLPATTPSTFITPPIFTLSYVHLPVTSVPAAASVKASHPLPNLEPSTISHNITWSTNWIVRYSHFTILL